MATETVHDFREPYYEIINGEKFLRHGDNFKHNTINNNLIMLIGTYVAKNRLGFIFFNLKTQLPDGNQFYPDFMIVDRTQERLVIDNKHKPFCGVPDMAVEIFSRSTMRNDIGIKKDVYERNGVKEYWMIDPWRESVTVYLLRDGKYELDEIYHNYSKDELSELTDEERAAIPLEVPVAVLDGFKIKIKNIFGWFIE